ncbi:MAG: beta strand repeat-containing protein, partial [Microcystis panniformis]
MSSSLTSGVTQIFSTDTAFAALKSDGSVVTWGNSSLGGNSSSVSSSLTSGVTQIFSNDYAFAALKSDGSVVTWGESSNGGNSSSVSSSLTSGVTQIFSTFGAFAALKSDGSVVTWGNSSLGGNSSSVSSSLTSGVTQIFSTSEAFAALKSDGSVVTWGDSTSGGNSSSVSSSLTSGVTQIFSNGSEFAALKRDGSVVTWGFYGGDSSSVSSPLTSGVVSFADPFNDDRLVPSSTPFITLAVSPTSVTEDGTSNLIYTFSRTGSTTSPLTVNYTIGGTASNGTDYTNIGTSVTFAAGSSTATVTVDPTPDSTPEDHETVSLTLASGTGYNIGTTAAVTGTIFDDDTIVTLAVSPTSVTEDGTTNLVYTFTRNGITSNALTVNYFIGGSATNGNDYSSIGSSVTFAAGSSTATVTVDPAADNTLEADETVILSLASGTGYTIGTTTSVTGTIVNDDASVSLAVSPSTVTEDGIANLVYTFTRTGAISNALTVNYAVGGTATFNNDYTQTGATAYTTTTGTVTFAAGASTATVTIDPTNDATVESDETVALTLVSGTGYAIATTGTVTGTILNNDAPTNLILPNRNILEDQPVGAVVSELISIDPDTGNILTYSLVAGTGSTDNNAFTITNNQLKTNAVFDFETKNSYNIRLRTTDQGGLSFERAFTIGVISSATPTQIVTTLQDVTSSTDGFLSLREAIAQANTANVNGTFLLGEGRYTLATADDLDIQLQGKTLTIQGQGKDLTILDGNSLDRFFEVHSGATVILSGVTITNGKADFGGAIYNSGNLSISDSKIENNQALGMNGVNGAAGSDGYPSGGNPRAGGTGGDGWGGGDAGGGAIYNGGIITIINTAISNNQAIGGRGGNGGSGGSGSWAGLSGPPFIGGRGGDGGYGGDGGDAWGGGLFNAGQATLTNITVGSHSITAGTGGSAGSGGSGGRNATTGYASSGSPGIAGTSGSAWGSFIYNLNSGSISSNGTLNGVFNAGGSVVANGWAVVTVAVAPVSVSEDGSSNLVYTFTRTGSTTNTLTVNYTVGGTATLGTDYTGISTTGAAKTLTFAAGSSTAIVTVDPTADTTFEYDETVVLTLTHGEDYSPSATSSATGTIANDETQVTLAVSPTSITEDGTPNLIYTFTRTGVTTNALTVNYTVGGTATISTDYTGIATAETTKTVTFATGSSTATVTVDPTADTTVESDETVILTLASGTGYTIGNTSEVTGTITNDDFPSVTLAVSPTSVTEDGTPNLIYTFTRTGVTTNALTVNYTVGGTATIGTDYTGIATAGT